jgi:hypothetical protein
MLIEIDMKVNNREAWFYLLSFMLYMKKFKKNEKESHLQKLKSGN